MSLGGCWQSASRLSQFYSLLAIRQTKRNLKRRGKWLTAETYVPTTGMCVLNVFVSLTTVRTFSSAASFSVSVYCRWLDDRARDPSPEKKTQKNTKKRASFSHTTSGDSQRVPWMTMGRRIATIHIRKHSRWGIFKSIRGNTFFQREKINRIIQIGTESITCENEKEVKYDVMHNGSLSNRFTSFPYWINNRETQITVCSYQNFVLERGFLNYGTTINKKVYLFKCCQFLNFPSCYVVINRDKSQPAKTFIFAHLHNYMVSKFDYFLTFTTLCGE